LFGTPPATQEWESTPNKFRGVAHCHRRHFEGGLPKKQLQSTGRNHRINMR